MFNLSEKLLNLKNDIERIISLIEFNLKDYLFRQMNEELNERADS